jgi:tripartite-type tricarboxylate transporter receptor subunit TctC
MKRLLISVATALSLTSAASILHAQPAYPQKPVSVLVGFAAGGGVDQMARAISTRLGEILGQPIVIDIRAGASGMIAAGFVAKSKPDGYTLLMGHVSSNAMVPAITPKMPYNAATDFTPIAMIGSVPQLVVVPMSSPAKTLPEFIAMVQSKKGTANYGSAGIATPPHFAGELFQMVTKTTMTHVPYKGGGASLTDLVAGQVDVGFDTVPTLLQQVKSGRLRALAVIGNKRISSLPDVPSTAELGLPDFEIGAWYMLMGPANLPQDVRDALNQAVNKALQTPSVREQLSAMSTEIVGGTPEAAQAFLNNEISKWSKLAAEKKIVAQ